MDANDTKSAHPKSPGKIKWLVGAVLLLIAAAAAMNLPRGYNDDLSRIGKGSPVIVLVHNKNSPESIELMQVLDNVRGGYSGKIEFLLTEPNTPQGSTFMANTQAPQASLVLFDGKGNLVKVLNFRQTPESLHNEIQMAFGINP